MFGLYYRWIVSSNAFHILLFPDKASLLSSIINFEISVIHFFFLAQASVQTTDKYFLLFAFWGKYSFSMSSANSPHDDAVCHQFAHRFFSNRG